MKLDLILTICRHSALIVPFQNKVILSLDHLKYRQYLDLLFHIELNKVDRLLTGLLGQWLGGFEKKTTQVNF